MFKFWPDCRVCITGRAGTGKTTLLQYIAYRWSCEEALWHNPFDFVFQVKLNLLGKADFWPTVPGYSDLDHLVLLIHKSLGGSHAFSLENIRACLTQFPHRILLLDSFDEIQSLYGTNDKVKALIDYAMNPVNFPNGILTSRPNAVPLPWLEKGAAPRFSQYFENLGLTEEDVRDYVQRCFKSMPALSTSLLAALSSNVDMMRLAQIPVNISALCLIWTQEQHKKSSVSPTEVDTTSSVFTMTILYQRVILCLARRYVVNVKQVSPQERDPHKIFEACHAEMTLLASLAYQAFERGETQTLSPKLLEDCRVPGELLEQIRLQFGILRKAEVSLLDVYEPHYFIHLTYQEYFVALYMAQKLAELPSENREQEILRRTTIQAMARLIQAKKSEPRYAVIWNFLSGIVSTPEYARGANYFWDAYIDEFESVLSPIVIGLHPYMKKLESQQRIYREALMTNAASRIPSHVVPERLAVLQLAIQSVFQWQAVCQIKDLNPLWDGDDNDYDDKPSEAIEAARCLEEQDQQQAQYTCKILDWPRLPTLSLHTFLAQNPALVSSLQEARARLLSGKGIVSHWAAGNLGDLEIIDVESLTVLHVALNNSDNDGDVRMAVARALGNLRATDAESLIALRAALKDRVVKVNAAEALLKIDNTDAESLTVLRAALKNRVTAETAAVALGSLKITDVEVFTALRVSLKNGFSRERAAEALGRNLKITDVESLTVLRAALKDSDEGVRVAAIRALVNLKMIDAELFTILRTILEDSNSSACVVAAVALLKINSADVESLTVLRAALKSVFGDVCVPAAVALLKIDSTDIESLAVLRAALKDSIERARFVSLRALKHMFIILQEKATLLALLEAAQLGMGAPVELQLMSIILLRVLPVTYAALAELLTHTIAQRFFVMSVWLHGSSVVIDIEKRQMIVDGQTFPLSGTLEVLQTFVQQLQIYQAEFIRTVTASSSELVPILHMLTQPIILPCITSVFEPNFLTDHLPAVPKDRVLSAIEALFECLSQMQTEIYQRLHSGEILTQEQQGELARLGNDLRGAQGKIVHLQQQAGSSVSEMDFDPVAEQVSQLQSRLSQLELESAQLKTVAVAVATDAPRVAHSMGRGIFELVPAPQADEVSLNTISFSFKSTGAP